MIAKKLLIIDDDARLRAALVEDFRERGYETFDCAQVSEFKGHVFDYAIVDLRILGDSGLSAVTELRKQNAKCKIVILTGYGSVATAVEAMKLGAVNYLNKPASADTIEAALQDRLKETQALQNRVKHLDEQEHEYIEFILAQNKGNITRTAQQLGIHRQSLQRKLKKYP